MFEVNNRNTRTRCGICLKLTVKAVEVSSNKKTNLWETWVHQREYGCLVVELRFHKSSLCEKRKQ